MNFFRAMIAACLLCSVPCLCHAVGTGWIQQTAAAGWSPRDSMGELVYNNQMWLFGGFAPGRVNEVWRSSNGLSWTQVTSAAPWSARNLPSTLLFDNKMWLIGGFNGSVGTNDVWSSTDGASWTAATTSAPWGRRSAAGAVVFNNRMWILGGMGKLDGTEHYNDVWSSADGVNWTQESPAAPWSQRGMLQSLVYDNKIWVFGGGIYNSAYPYNSQDNFGDVWSSSDGVNWTQATPEAPWRERRFHATTVFDGRMWMVAGYATENAPLGNRKDVWYSTDGVKWTQLTPSVPWPIRHEASVLTFDDALWVAGGFGDVLYNDVWSYKPETPTWQVNQSGDWLLSTNWAGGVSPTWRGATANLTLATSAVRTVFINEPIALGTLNISNAQGYVIAGAGSLTMDVMSGNAAISVSSGKQNLNLPMRIADPLTIDVATGAQLLLSDPVRIASGAALTKNGGGTLSILSSFRCDAPTTLKINGGNVAFISPLSDTNLSIHIDPATVEFASSQHLGSMNLELGGNTIVFSPSARDVLVSVESLKVDGRGNTLQTSAAQSLEVRGDLHIASQSELIHAGEGALTARQLLIEPTGRLLLGNGSIIAENESLDQVRTLLLRGELSDDGLLALASSSGERLLYFQTDSGVEIRRGLAGDLNIDQQVDISDLRQIAAHWNMTGYWNQGDLNYDGVISLVDLQLLAPNWRSHLTGVDNQTSFNAALQSLGLPLVLVPEPVAGTMLLSLGAMLIRPRKLIA